MKVAKLTAWKPTLTNLKAQVMISKLQLYRNLCRVNFLTPCLNQHIMRFGQLVEVGDHFPRCHQFNSGLGLQFSVDVLDVPFDGEGRDE